MASWGPLEDHGCAMLRLSPFSAAAVHPTSPTRPWAQLGAPGLTRLAKNHLETFESFLIPFMGVPWPFLTLAGLVRGGDWHVAKEYWAYFGEWGMGATGEPLSAKGSLYFPQSMLFALPAF